MRDPFGMSTSNISVGKAKVQIAPSPAKASTAKGLTAAWRKRVKHIRLNRPGQKRLTLHQLIAQGRR